MKSDGAVHGIVIVDKPGGMTSHDVVGVLRRLYRTRRVGHTGTLDPDATGVLVVCLGNATRLVEHLMGARKNYVAEIVFGVETSTQDASGEVTAERDASFVDAASVQAVLPRFLGAIQQVPPMVSALHHQGRRLYDLAREGVEVERAPRDITVDRMDLLAFCAAPRPVATIEVTCSTGTYIRTLAADIGTALGVGAMMRSLRRMWVGSEEAGAFRLEQAHTLEDLRAREAAGTLDETLIPLAAAVQGWAQVVLDEERLVLVRQGKRLPLDELGAEAPPALDVREETSRVAVMDLNGAVCALARIRDGRLEPVKVFV